MAFIKEGGFATITTDYKKEVVEKALDGWTHEQFTAKSFAAYDDNHKPIAWCALGRLLYISNDSNVPTSIDIDFKRKYGHSIASTNDGWLGYWRVKSRLRRLYA